MKYDISAVSNRDLQLLYEYRILRQPSDKLSAVLTKSGIGANLRYDNRQENGYFVYRVDTAIQDNLIPFIEFNTTKQEHIDCITELIELEIIDDAIYIYGTAEIDTTIPLTVYWCPSLAMIESVLNDVKKQLVDLKNTLDDLSHAIEKIQKYDNATAYADGLVTNLVKIQKNEDGNAIVDSLYRIETAVAERLFVNLSQQELDTMVHAFNKSVEFRFTVNKDYVLQNFTSPIMSITGTGNLTLKNIRAQVIIHGFKGNINIIDCPEVHIEAYNKNDICTIDNLKVIRNSCVYLENICHYLENVYLMLNSTIRHRRGHVKNLMWVGYGCTYWCNRDVWVPGINYLRGSQRNTSTVYDFNILHILGTIQQDSSNFFIHNTRCIGFKVANSDPPTMLSTVECEWEAEYTGGGGGDVPTPVTGNSPRAKVYNWFVANTSFSKEVICGILGNIQQESNFDPFVAGGHYGLWQTDDPDLRTAMANAGLSNLWHSMPTWQTWEGHCTEEQWNTAVSVQLQVLKDSHYGGVDFVTSDLYFERNLDKVQSSAGLAGVRSYCELFCAMCERCIGGIHDDPITDPVVYDFIMDHVYSGADYTYQELVERRDFATTIYSEIG